MKPKLKGSAKRRESPYPLGEIPRQVVLTIGKQIVHRIAVGFKDIPGDDFGNIFANAIGGTHRKSPLGLTDVVKGDCAWSVKTVKKDNPFTTPKLRLISGRNSPDYSMGISDPRENIQATGDAVLRIWNNRLDEALHEYEELRSIVLIRNMETREFTLFEEEISRYIPSNYAWRENKSKNFEGYLRGSDSPAFTWQPHGAQFTIHHHVPEAAVKFHIAHDVPIIPERDILGLASYKDSWIKIVDASRSP